MTHIQTIGIRWGPSLEGIGGEARLGFTHRAACSAGDVMHVARRVNVE